MVNATVAAFGAIAGELTLLPLGGIIGLGAFYGFTTALALLLIQSLDLRWRKRRLSIPSDMVNGSA